VCSLPSPVTFGRSRVWKGNIKLLQSEVSAVSRVVIHPKYRSIGLGAKLVAETLSQAETSYVETTAVMAKYNPFFEKAGMQRIAESKPSEHVLNALNQLEGLGFDIALMGSASFNEQKINQTTAKHIIDILTELSQRDGSIRRRLASTKNIYPKHEEFAAKIACFGVSELAVALKRLSFCAQGKVYLFWKKQASV
jgi:tRNA(Met) C34 N-acetyltransferase TmcA